MRILIILALLFAFMAPAFAATCYGLTPCDACKNCRYCKHCNRDRGTCGVCKR